MVGPMLLLQLAVFAIQALPQLLVHGIGLALVLMGEIVLLVRLIKDRVVLLWEDLQLLADQLLAVDCLFHLVRPGGLLLDIQQLLLEV